MMTNTEYDPLILDALRTTLVSSESLDSALGEMLSGFKSLIRAKSQRMYFEAYIKGLLSPLDRKSVEPIALHLLGERLVRPMQQLLARSPLADDELAALHRRTLAGLVSSPGGMLSVDETTFVKKGSHSAGVKRQYCGRLGKTENCQVGVFLAYAGEAGFGLVDKGLYLPQDWLGEERSALRKECRIPEGRAFETKNSMAQRMLNKALREGHFDAAWIGCDAAYGMDHSFLDGLEAPAGVHYFAATTSKERVFLERPAELWREASRGRPPRHPKLSAKPVSVASIAAGEAFPWAEATLAEGTKGPILARVKRLRCVAARADGNRNYTKAGGDIWLYIREYGNGDVKYFVSNAPWDTPAGELDRAATLRWPIEQCFEECKGFLGMSHYECRTLQGWERHMLFVMIAQLFLRSLQLTLKKTASQPL